MPDAIHLDPVFKVAHPDKLFIGSEWNAVAVGRAADPDLADHRIAEGKAEGARLVAGGERPGHLDRGYFIQPTLFGNVANSMAIAREEIFGPVTSVIPYDSLDQAIEIANDSIFGLGGCVFTNDDAAYRVARRVRTGTVSQNDFDADFNIAFGGFKQSGVGREGGTEGLMEFLETTTLLLRNYPAELA